MGLMAEKDGKEGNVLIMLALPETIIILSFVIAFFLIGKIIG
jgi:F0F1-type ATP synthase membrane subunit c/vacuolar-type H+-ATPase subunit K